MFPCPHLCHWPMAGIGERDLSYVGAGKACAVLDANIVIYVLKRRPVEVLSTSAHARSEGLVLVTYNIGEFARVPALEAEILIVQGAADMSLKTIVQVLAGNQPPSLARAA